MRSRVLFLTLLAPLALSFAARAQFDTVHTLTNDPAANGVATFLRVPFLPSLLPIHTYETGGAGTGGGLGSQEALIASSNGRFVLAVNAGSDEITVFRSFLRGLFLARTAHRPSGGPRPTSVAEHHGLVYVLNAGVPNSVQGFRLGPFGDLREMRDANYTLSAADTAPAQVSFSPDGRFLIVTERATDRIVVFPVRRDGRLGNRVENVSAGPTPFGFAFDDRGTLIVSEAAGGNPNASSVSSYVVRRDGTLLTVTAALGTDQTAACWIAIPWRGGFAYTTNTGSGSVTGYAVGLGGDLERLSLTNPRTGDPGRMDTGPLDAAFDRSGRTLYVLHAGTDEIAGYRRLNDGSLRYLGSLAPLPDGAAGMLAR